MNRLLLTLLLGLIGCGSNGDGPETTGPDEPVAVERDLDDVVLHFISNSGQPSLEPGTYVVATRDAFLKARRENPKLPEKFLPVPDGVDFAAVRRAVRAPELSSSSARLKFKGVRVGPTGYTVRYRVDANDGGGAKAYPALLVELPLDEQPVTFEKLD